MNWDIEYIKNGILIEYAEILKRPIPSQKDGDPKRQEYYEDIFTSSTKFHINNFLHIIC